MKKLIGKTIDRIYINADYIKFKTDKGEVCYQAYGYCCSYSYLHDFAGVSRLLIGNPVTAVEEIPEKDGDGTCIFSCKKCAEANQLKLYGYRIITEDKDFGPVSSVLAFRNDSNGYYGGSLNLIDSIPKDQKLENIISEWHYNI